ncbi:MAG: hypothetical protein JW950_08835 [Deltaproteobacteria bacterium]|nr:hypothetical protein [Deltaproteobacteria bacterium]
MHFNTFQMSVTQKAFMEAERLTGRFYYFSPEAFNIHRYDVKNLPYLESHEVVEEAFAHLCRYQYQKHPEAPAEDGYHFYRICLQDNRILDAVERAGSFIKLGPLMLYIATHELVHVVRFDQGASDFDASPKEKEREEDRVHDITRQILKSVLYPDLKLVLDCFSNDYRIGDLYN